MKESERLELKESLRQEEDILKTICAFANTSGGEILIGIDEDGNITGVDIGKNTLENIATKASAVIRSSLGISINASEMEEKSIIRIKVPESDAKPHFYKGRAYKRVGTVTTFMEPSELEQMIIKKAMSEHNIATKVFEEASLSDIDEKSLRGYVNELGTKYVSLKTSLVNLGLLRNEKITGGAILFFGKDPSKFFPLYGTKCAIIKGGEILEMVDFRDNLYKIVGNVLNFVMSRIPTRIQIIGLKRVDIPILPEEAVREAIINAVVHRDYAINSSIYVSLFDNRIEVKNPGMLPAGLTVEDLYGFHESRPRNPVLAELANKIRWIEHWGTGTLKIVRLMRERGLEDPKFAEKNGFFTVALPFTTPKLSIRQEKIIAILKRADQPLAFSELKKHFTVSDRSLRLDLVGLVRSGFIKRTGAGRITKYLL